MPVNVINDKRHAYLLANLCEELNQLLLRKMMEKQCSDNHVKPHLRELCRENIGMKESDIGQVRKIFPGVFDNVGIRVDPDKIHPDTISYCP